MKATAAVFRGSGKPFELMELPVREVEPGGVLVRNTTASICGSDLHAWRGDADKPWDKPPTIIGHEFTGVVAAIGKGGEEDSLRRTIKEGDRLAFPFFFPCHKCYHCIRGEYHACQYRSRPSNQGIEKYPYADGGYSQYFYLPQGTYKFKTPDSLPDEAITPVNCAFAQVLFALELIDIRFGSTIVIQGAGGLGIYATVVAADKGASQVIVIDGHESRLAFAKRCGATATINIKEVPSPEERVALVRDLTNGIGADVAVEVVGVPDSAYEGLEMLRVGGTYLDIGNISGGRLDIPANKIIIKQIRWIGVQHYNPWIIEAALDFLERTQSKYPLTSIVSDSVPLEKIDDAFELAEWQGLKEVTDARRVVVKL